MKLCSLLCLTFFALTANATEAPLFDSHSVLELSLKVNFKSLCRPRETEDCDYAATILELTDEENTSRAIPAEIRVRGGWRALRENCSVPPLFIRFTEMDTTNSPFEGQSMLPITTHCRNGGGTINNMSLSINTDYEQYLLKEYLGYRLYNILTDTSMRVRLARIKYINPEKPRQSTTRYAFFTEHFKSAASRSGAKLLPRESFNHEQLDSGTANLLALYQFMIGNTDWSIVRQRNTILIERPGGIQVPLPYDFDMSGLVNAAYAGPPPTLPIDDVRQRYFLGFCDPAIAWDSSFNAVHQKQLEILALPGEIPGLHKSDRRNAKRYLEKFFNILASDERRTEKIVGACQPWPPSGVDHMSRELNESSRRK